MIAATLLAVVLPSAGVTPACEKLMREFIRTEFTYGAIADSYETTGIAALRYGAATGDMARYRKRSAEQAALNEEYAQKAERMGALLTMNNCPPPDHMMSPDTYRKERKVCLAAGQGDQTAICDYEQKALERWAGASKPVAKKAPLKK